MILKMLRLVVFFLPFILASWSFLCRVHAYLTLEYRHPIPPLIFGDNFEGLKLSFKGTCLNCSRSNTTLK